MRLCGNGWNIAETCQPEPLKSEIREATRRDGELSYVN